MTRLFPLLLVLHKAVAQPVGQCLFTPDFAARHRCVGINHSNPHRPWEAACRKLQCMSCVAQEESLEQCRDGWKEACAWGREALNRPPCESKCTTSFCAQRCQSEFGSDFEPISCNIRLGQSGGFCDVQCRKKCIDDPRQLPGGQWYCCKNGTYIQKIIGDQEFSTCDGSALPMSLTTDACAECSVYCDGAYYEACRWKSWSSVRSGASRPSPMQSISVLSTAVVLSLHSLEIVGSGFLPVALFPLISFSLLASIITGAELQISPDSQGKHEHHLRDGSSQLHQHVGEVANSCMTVKADRNPIHRGKLWPLNRSVALAEQLKLKEVKTVTALQYIMVASESVLAVAQTSKSIDLWRLSAYSIQAIVGSITTDAVPRVMTVFHANVLGSDTEIAPHLVAGSDDGHVFVWRLAVKEHAETDPVHLAMEELLKDKQAHHGHEITALLVVPYSEGVLISAGLDRRLVFRRIGRLNVVAGEITDYGWPVVALAWIASWNGGTGMLAVAGDYDQVSFWIPHEMASTCLEWKLVRHSAPALSLSAVDSSPQRRADILVDIPQREFSVPLLAVGSEDGFRVVSESGLELLTWRGIVIGGPVWLAGAGVLLILSQAGRSADRIEMRLFGQSPADINSTIRELVNLPLPITPRSRGQLLFLDTYEELLVFGMEDQLSILKLVTKLCEQGARPEEGHQRCTPCPAGHAGSMDPGSCRRCSPGKYQPSPGSPACIDCPPGRASKVEGALACDQCPEGRFSGSSGYAHCNGTCPDGYQSILTGCELCPVGRAGQGGFCYGCPSWQLATRKGLTSCSEFCSPGDFADVDRLKCISFTPVDPELEPLSPLWYLLGVVVAIAGVIVGYCIFQRW